MGPLKGVTILEIAGIGPGPFCAMMLADMGANVIRIDRVGKGGGLALGDPTKDVLNRGRRSLAVDLKSKEGVALILKLVERADGLVEGFRPGVMERLGLGPDECLAQNGSLVYGRMTGWGQGGPLAKSAGHDLNYIALSGVLHAIGRETGKPAIPLNLIGDFGGGGLMLAFGMVCALLEAKSSGQGQVVDAAMVDGSAVLASFLYGLDASGLWQPERERNLLDGGAPYYDVYETGDGEYVALGPLEPQFFAELIKRLELDEDLLSAHMNPARWPELRKAITARMKEKTRAEWQELLEGTDVCFAPVLSYKEAPTHPHNRARATYVEAFGITQPRPAPRFSRTDPDIPDAPPVPGQDTNEVLAEFGFNRAEISALAESGAVRQSDD